ncbi:hypothetical protein BKA80DRAFT_275584 [Phyllosticta citrichinensis]
MYCSPSRSRGLPKPAGYRSGCDALAKLLDHPPGYALDVRVDVFLQLCLFFAELPSEKISCEDERTFTIWVQVPSCCGDHSIYHACFETTRGIPPDSVSRDLRKNPEQRLTGTTLLSGLYLNEHFLRLFQTSSWLVSAMACPPSSWLGTHLKIQVPPALSFALAMETTAWICQFLSASSGVDIRSLLIAVSKRFFLSYQRSHQGASC